MICIKILNENNKNNYNNIYLKLNFVLILINLLKKFILN